MQENGINEWMKPRPECLTPDQLALLASDRRPADRARLADHLAACSRCAAEAALLRSFEEAEETAGERPALAAITAGLDQFRAARWPTAAARKASWRQWFSLPPMRTWALVSASVLLLMAGSFYLRTVREPVIPEDGGGQMVRSAAIEAVGPRGELARIPDEFVWNAAEGAVRYRVTVRDVAGAPLWSGESTSPHLAVPAELRPQLLPGRALLWEVEALANGKVVGSSGRVRFVVKQP